MTGGDSLVLGGEREEIECAAMAPGVSQFCW